MGIIEEVTLPGVELDFKVSDELMNILAAANSHKYSRLLEKVPETDGLYLQVHLYSMMSLRFTGGIYKQCDCVTHAELLQEKTVNCKRHLRQLLQTETSLQDDTGIGFAIAL